MNANRATAVWMAGALLIAAIALTASLASQKTKLLRLGWTPIDLTHPEGAAMWHLLRTASDIIPPGESYTIRARKSSDEMYLFMMSLGVLVHCTGFPSSYFDRDTGPVGKRARYVIVYRNQIPPGRGERLIKTFREGSLYRRDAGP